MNLRIINLVIACVCLTSNAQSKDSTFKSNLLIEKLKESIENKN
jgi:hypothetical protein